MACNGRMDRGLESRRDAPSQHDRAAQSRIGPAGDGLIGADMVSRRRYCERPRDTRSISAFTMRSTSPGRLSSSQDFSIGRNISLTRSSSVRALLLSTVWASVLKADSTAETVLWDRIAACGVDDAGVGSNAGGS